jgi:preprotein translocase subunit SecB
MSDEQRGDGQSTIPAAAPQAPDQAQQLILNAQYIKDLSFESPRAPQILLQPVQPAVDVNVDVRGRNVGTDVYEVVLTINATAKVGADTVFLIELAYGGVVTIRNVPQAMMGFAVFVETPRLLFPFARAIIANATRDGGFPPLLINPIDFADLLRRQQAAAGGVPPSVPSAGV